MSGRLARAAALVAVTVVPALEGEVELLRAVPGRTMVTTEWWREALDGLRLSSIIERERTAAI